jgi:nicotinate-nucleotide adenylyltransferase
MRFGIFGGSFNPVHFGHLLPVSVAFDELSLDKILFVPARKPPHKSSANLLEPRHRLNMLRLALADDPRFEISEYELNESNSSYTIDTLTHFKGIYPSDELFLLIGSDSLLDLKKWHRWEELFDYAKIAVLCRPCFDVERIKGEILERIVIVNTPLVEISSSEIRSRLVYGQSIRYFTPDAVLRYISDNCLFLEQ